MRERWRLIALTDELMRNTTVSVRSDKELWSGQGLHLEISL
jgi:hypothetical protein